LLIAYSFDNEATFEALCWWGICVVSFEKIQLEMAGLWFESRLLVEWCLGRETSFPALRISKPSLGFSISRLGLEKPKFGIKLFLNSFLF